MVGGASLAVARAGFPTERTQPRSKAEGLREWVRMMRLNFVYETIRIRLLPCVSFTEIGGSMGAGKVRGGRPRKSADLRDTTVSFRVTQAEWHYLADLALNEGLSLNDLLRSLALVGMSVGGTDRLHGVSPVPLP